MASTVHRVTAVYGERVDSCLVAHGSVVRKQSISSSTTSKMITSTPFFAPPFPFPIQIHHPHYARTQANDSSTAPQTRHPSTSAHHTGSHLLDQRLPLDRGWEECMEKVVPGEKGGRVRIAFVSGEMLMS